LADARSYPDYDNSIMKKPEMEWKVLFIDDEEGIRTVMSIVLADAGYKVITAESGENGIDLRREHSPQIVITDLRMPGMDGIEVLRRIKEEDPNTEVIVVTAFGEMDAAIRALQSDASDFITKPINDEALFVALERAKMRYTTRKELQDYTTLLEKRWMDTAEELAKTFTYQDNLIESSIDGIMGCGKEGTVIIYNKSMENILGYPKDEVIKKMHYDQFFPAGGAENFREALDSEDYGGKNRLFLYETNLVCKNEDKIPVQLSATVLFEGKEEIGMVGFFRDLRKMRKLEQEFADQARLLHQDKMITLGRLVASVVHEINNPLAGILNYLRLMIKILSSRALDQEQMEKFQRYLNLVEGETSRCSRIVSSLLAFSRKSETEFKRIDLQQLLQKCMMLSQHKLELQNIQVRINPDSNMPNVWGDFNQIQQCLINLIFNAIDAMPSGGTLSIVCSHDKNRDMVEITVKDTGRGIAKEDLPHIFDPFYTTKMEGEGLGLGLATVQGIIERHKGTIHVESEMGRGTAFIIRLPV
jgi:two-component system NtrC family sensor kinase